MRRVLHAAGATALLGRGIASHGRITDEDRRWWLVHLECCPDVGAGTFHTWLDSCGEHTAKKLIERNVWSIEQVAGLSSDEVDELRYKEGCMHMDVVWEHARTVLTPLKARTTGASAESALQDRILELRKKRELQRRRTQVLEERQEQTAGREETLRQLREQIAKKKEALRKRQHAQGEGSAVGEAMEKLHQEQP